ncbi:MAG: GNAT family N-acetyltransferase [Acidobacteria bacterium]|nr:GNAT family N-acetyltransferase [Acidobacteriota bacterium]
MRRYESRDLESVVEVFRSNIPKYFTPGEESELREFLEKEAEEYYVAETGGEIIGAGGVALNKDQTVSLCWGMIRADHLGTGKGLELTEFRIQKAQEKYGLLPIVISTSQHTQGFYEKLGFQMTKHVPEGFGPGIDICEMRLNVSTTDTHR